MTGGFDNQALGFSITTNNSVNGDTKLSEDRYEIYVNGDFVGYKSLLNVNDTMGDVDDFLKSQGINEFLSQQDGDHYYIKASDSARIKDALNVYCHNR